MTHKLTDEPGRLCVATRLHFTSVEFIQNHQSDTSPINRVVCIEAPSRAAVRAGLRRGASGLVIGGLKDGLNRCLRVWVVACF